jgi:hypothetical protein
MSHKMGERCIKASLSGSIPGSPTNLKMKTMKTKRETTQSIINHFM